MEPFICGDRRETGFPQEISPFPETEGVFFSNATVEIHSSSPPPPPPQKLRPIRANARSPCSSQGNDLSLSGGGCSGGLDGSFENLELLVEQVCGMNGESSDIFKTLMKAEDRETQHTRPDLNGRNCDTNCGGGLPGDDGSSSSSDDDTSSGVNEHGSQKRKRKGKKKLEDFLESMVMKVLDKQEQMNKQLIKTIERRERERVIREEAWKQQEMERMKRDGEIRAQENARNLDLISFIQGVMGHKVEFPQPLTMFPYSDKSEDKDASNSPIKKISTVTQVIEDGQKQK